MIDGSALRHEVGIPADAPLVLHLAPIHPNQRQEDTVRAFALAQRRVPALHCLLVGEEAPYYTGPVPDYKAELRAIAAQAGLADRLIIAPPHPDTPELLAAADMVIMPALDDPYPRTITEAMAAGTPVIGADFGSVPEFDHRRRDRLPRPAPGTRRLGRQNRHPGERPGPLRHHEPGRPPARRTRLQRGRASPPSSPRSTSSSLPLTANGWTRFRCSRSRET